MVDIQDVSRLPSLTSKQQKFVENVLDGLSLSASYRKAYDTNGDPRSVWVAASRLAANVKVKLWLDHAKSSTLKQHTVTLESHLNRLDELQRQCLENNNYGAAVKCEELKARAAGLYVSRTEDITETRSLGELLADAEKEFGEEAAQAIKVALGLARPEKAKLKAVP